MKIVCITIALASFISIAFTQTYDLWGFTDQGATHATAANYNIWGSFGKATCGKMTGGNYALNGGYYYTEIEEILTQPEQRFTFSLSQNYPNPFHFYTSTEYTIAKTSDVVVTIYSITGQIVKNIKAKSQKPGAHRIIWDGRDDKGQRVASGIYFFRLETDMHTASNKMLLLR